MIKRLTARELKIGMIAMEPVVTPHGQGIVPSGTELTRQIINKVKLYNVESVLVDVPEALAEPSPAPVPMPAVVPEPVVVPVPVVVPAPVIVPEPAVVPTPVVEPEPVVSSDADLMKNTRIAEMKPTSQAVVKSPEFMSFQVDYLLATSTLKTAFTNVVNDKNYHINESALVRSISLLYTSRNTITEVFDMIYQMRSIDDSIYSHCVNVALIARMIGRWLHLETRDLDILTCCGLLHDIGKIAIPDEILNKPDKLTDVEFNTIKSHPKIGLDMLRNQNIDERIKQAAFLHHERYDGSGYPNGFSNDMLPDFSTIIAIADVYDAMTASRSYREPLCPFQVIASFEQDGFQKYNTQFLLLFLNRIATTYQSNRVLLNDGRAGKIVMLNQQYLSKPIVQLDNGDCLDLSHESQLYIQKVL